MQVFTARSSETYDMAFLCTNLDKQIQENVTFGINSLGILICDSTIDYKEVVALLSQKYTFKIYGCTALAFIHVGKAEDISTSFMVITGDEDLVVSTALTQPLNAQNSEDAVCAAYEKAREQLP
ncbi:hypothetical protein U6B65_07225 [Oscillospiraceae bacterium MB08-C2-2]|nr:hypothetical protein U6B65_07225 [Oscillospiraceae bacterium MB08-C2-2]